MLGVGVGVADVEGVGVAPALGGVGGTVAWLNSSTPVGATTVVSIPADVSWAATFSATFTSAGRSAAAPTVSCTARPPRHWPSSSRVQPAEVSSDVASGRVVGAVPAYPSCDGASAKASAGSASGATAARTALRSTRPSIARRTRVSASGPPSVRKASSVTTG